MLTQDKGSTHVVPKQFRNKNDYVTKTITLYKIINHKFGTIQ